MSTHEHSHTCARTQFKLLLFTPYQRAVKGFYALGILAHMVVVMVAVGQASTSRNAYYQCANAYPLLYRQQYVIEVSVVRGAPCPLRGQPPLDVPRCIRAAILPSRLCLPRNPRTLIRTHPRTPPPP